MPIIRPDLPALKAIAARDGLTIPSSELEQYRAAAAALGRGTWSRPRTT